MDERFVRIGESFEKRFGKKPEAYFSAPGRTEVMGNHTDHQRGEVLAASIDKDTYAAAMPSGDMNVKVCAEGYGEFNIDLTDLTVKEEEKGTTAALIRGVAAGFKNRGYEIGGFFAVTDSDVLSGSGLSSSASYESLIGIIMSELFNNGVVDRKEIAIIGKYAENEYFGKPCGLMDQMACSYGGLCHMDFSDPEHPIVEPVENDPCDFGYSLCITDTKGSHADLTDDYSAIPGEMRAAASVLGREVLCGVTSEEVIEHANEIRKSGGDRALLRAIHYAEEIERVHDAVDALAKKDIDRFIDCVKASGDSSYKYLQNVYTLKDPAVQAVSVGLAVSEKVLGENGVCRVHGGGFAGTIQAFVKNEAVDSYKEAMDKIFGDGACTVMKIRKEGVIRVR